MQQTPSPQSTDAHQQKPCVPPVQRTLKKFQKPISIAGGAGVGFLNGLFGGGGGMLCVPLLEKLLGEKTKTAHATAILLILPISIVSAIVYIVGGSFAWQPTLYTGLGVVAGGVAGALLLKILPEKIVGFVFAGLMIAAGIRMAFF